MRYCKTYECVELRGRSEFLYLVNVEFYREIVKYREISKNYLKEAKKVV